MASAEATIVFPSLDNSLGAMLLGAFLSTILYGISVLQTYRYLKTPSNDTSFIKTMVFISFGFETVEVVFVTHTLYHYCVTNYANARALSFSVWSLNFVYIFATFATISSQLFFARRVSKIALEFKIAALFTILFFGLRLGCAIYLTSKGISTNEIGFLKDDRLLISLCAGSAAAADITLTGSLLIVLRRGRKVQKRNETFMGIFMIYVINTGLLVTVTDISAFILALASPGNMWWTIPSLITTRLYANTLLSVLNSRKLAATRGEDMFNATTLGRHAITRANRLATIERWNLPETTEAPPPELIDIKVTTEVQGDDASSGVDGQATKFRPESV